MTDATIEQTEATPEIPEYEIPSDEQLLLNFIGRYSHYTPREFDAIFGGFATNKVKNSKAYEDFVTKATEYPDTPLGLLADPKRFPLELINNQRVTAKWVETHPWITKGTFYKSGIQEPKGNLLVKLEPITDPTVPVTGFKLEGILVGYGDNKEPIIDRNNIEKYQDLYNNMLRRDGYLPSITPSPLV